MTSAWHCDTITAMNSNQTFDEIVARITQGNREAYDFLIRFHTLAHAIDDLIDEKRDDEWKLCLFLRVITFFSLDPFYNKHKEQLFPMVIIALNDYATSVAWEKEVVANQPHKIMADHLRSNGQAIVEYVAFMCGGLEAMREVSPISWENSWKNHHDPEGKPC